MSLDEERNGLNETAQIYSDDDTNAILRPNTSAPGGFNRMDSRDSESGKGTNGVGLLKKLRYQKSVKSELGDLALYEDEPVQTPLLSAYLSAFTLPGPVEKEQSDNKVKKANLGVLIGVYLPTIQHIFGVLMFLRLFWIVGTMGVWQAFAMVFLCCFCTFLTSISMSAIATNGVVEGGGSYFMISRNLGPEFGSAVGILFYLANTVATAMYLVGGVEIFLMYIVPEATIGGGKEIHDDTSPGGMMANNFRLYATILLCLSNVMEALRSQHATVLLQLAAADPIGLTMYPH